MRLMKAHDPPGRGDGFFGLTIGLRSLREPMAFLQDMARRYGDMAPIRVGAFLRISPHGPAFPAASSPPRQF
jgi:hypothetical protein